MPSALGKHLGRSLHAEDAPFNSLAKQHERTCLSKKRVGLLEKIHSWADERDKRCIFWLSGLAGTGKSTIARTVARYYRAGSANVRIQPTPGNTKITASQT
ncbi:hypothetical protein EJ02DRAFT_203243 [Clathrospora elynae]|uniref:Nephrocystin 3-like N-terminal domain-containing protein n=1 Tax=Clathrospora elynae TaxID=706981 RepID=A0A6A5SWW5_9PLEO|nr:hypothetical protein EJ02DRAFT_203243 [Clathrospora elynae]